MTVFQLSFALMWALVIVLAFVSLALLHLVANLRVQVNREADSGIRGHTLVAREINALPCRDVFSGEERVLGDFLKSKNILLVVSPGCGSCAAMLAEVRARAQIGFDGFSILVLCMASLKQCEPIASERIPSIPILAHSQDMHQPEFEEFLWLGWPAAMVVDDAGVVIDVRHPPTLKALLRTLTGAAYEPPQGSHRRREPTPLSLT